MNGHRDELDFACACLAPAGALPLAIPPQWDEAHFEQICRRHGIVGLVAARMQDEGLPVPPRLARWCATGERIAMEQVLSVLRLRSFLEAAGIPVLVLKGAALSQRLWGSPLLRRAADVDLLVPAKRVEEAWQVLAAAGYAMIRPARALNPAAARLYRRVTKDSLHQEVGQSLTIELHWRMSDEMADPGYPLKQDRQQIMLAPGRSVTILADEALFVYLCVHGAAHAWARLKWLADVARLAAIAPDGGDGMWRRAVADGAAVAAASALLLCEEFFGTPCPPVFRPPSSWRLSCLNHLARRTIRVGGGASDHATSLWRGWSEMAAKALVATGARQRLTVLRRLAVAGEDVAQLALPAGLGFLYPLVRIPMLIARRRQRRQRQIPSRTTGSSVQA